MSDEPIYRAENTETLRESLQKLLRSPKNTIVHSGHGENWTISETRNFFV
ncbi:hypothetical protein KAI54_02935 [Candidatus Gracilibacteria bacterium]|nr:hypothetical protein [Candidatus Gracilibacteria bacterium]